MSNLKIFDAPAGSGKSTEIRQRVGEWSERFPNDTLLCITYTNRAADALKAGISAANVDIATIHSFVARFLRPVFGLPEVIELFLRIYKSDIEARIANVEKKPHVDRSNERYEKRIGVPLSFDVVAGQITEISYNESPHNWLYSGGLSHDDLLSFAARCLAQFPGLRKRITQKYQVIIIDEYQDTNLFILEALTDVVDGSATSLHLYGDPMQQIYQLSSPRLRSVLNRFKREPRSVVNYRSSNSIVTCLNKIYNDPRLEQRADNTADSPLPRIHLTSTPRAVVDELEEPGTLILSVKNATIFDSIGAMNLFKAVDSMPNHTFGSRYPAASILTEPRWSEKHNSLLELLFGLLYLRDLYKEEKFGELIQTLKQHASVFGVSPVFNHRDKARLRNELEQVFEFLDIADPSIKEVLEHLNSSGWVQSSTLISYVESAQYHSLLEVSFDEVRNMHLFNLSPGWSTQHGVKGESHNNVIFIAEETRGNPAVYMNKLFNLWTEIPLNLDILEETYVAVSTRFNNAREVAKGYFSNPNKTTHAEHVDLIMTEARATFKACSDLPIFERLYMESFEAYFEKQNTSRASELFKIRPLEGLITAYRLFYVGCSRARKQLDVVVEVGQVADIDAFCRNFSELGFEIVMHP